MSNINLDYEKAIRQKLKDDFPHYASKCLKIRTRQGLIKPFVLNKAQRFVFDKLMEQRGKIGKIRALVLKGRQQGISTLINALYYHETTHSFGAQTFILTHALDATANLYKMVQRFHENTPDAVKPTATTSNSKELIFGLLDSGYKIGTAENKSVGRSATIQRFHGSEVAFWSNADEHAKGIMQAIPDLPGTSIILESTANGIGGYFHQMWQSAEAGETDYIAIFVPWFWDDDYKKEVNENFVRTIEESELVENYGLTDEQLNWRRNKIAELSVNGANGEKSFKQEYPCNPVEAFQMSGEDSFIKTNVVANARTKKDIEQYGPLVVGCDVARYGADRTSIIRRRGRVAYGLESYSKKDNMEIVGILVQIINNEKPDKILIDLGGGSGVVDRLKELGYGKIAIGVNFGSHALNGKVYANKRAEMWGEMRAWLEDEPCMIPDSDSLHADICGPQYKIKSNSQILLESKEDMKNKRKVRSPDEADALALTFALPAAAFIESQEDEIQTIIESSNYRRNQAIKRSYYGK